MNSGYLNRALLVAIALLLAGCQETSTSASAPVAKQNTVTANAVESESILDEVNLFVGTAGDFGQLHPAAAVPYGMIQVGPETAGKGHSGYDYNASELRGFSHNRTSGVGCRGAGGNLMLRADYQSSGEELVPLHKRTEEATPGYYRVEYGEPRIAVEMTASNASGWQRYTFPQAGSVTLSVDLSHAHHKFYDGGYSLLDDKSLTGHISGATVCDEGRYQVYFSLQTTPAPLEVQRQSDHKLLLRYEVGADEKLLVHSSFSSVDGETARATRLADATLGTFEEVRAQAAQKWHNKLSRFAIEGDPQKRALFYSHLYRQFLSPHLLAKQGNAYRSSDGKKYLADAHDHYFGWSIWDTFRTKFPLLTLIDSAEMADITASLALLYEQGKTSWATGTEPYITVRTEHSGILLLDAWRKGIRSFDAHKLLPLLAREADLMPRNSPDQILEAAYDAWAVAEFARLLGQDDLAEQYRAKAISYRQVWNEKFRHMGANSDVMHGDGLYEGTLWQYRWFVPFDTAWLIQQMGGEQAFSEELTTFFDRELFNMGNQPDIQTPFMFTFAGEAWRTQAQVYALLNEETRHWYGTHDKKDVPYVGHVFTLAPQSFIPEMDDDDGTMTGWYLFAAMGLYPVAPGVPVYSLHTPLFERLSLLLENGNTFTVLATDPGQPFIQSATLNGAPLNRAWLTHDEILAGATLEFVTGAEPNKEWGQQELFQTDIDRLERDYFK